MATAKTGQPSTRRTRWFKPLLGLAVVLIAAGWFFAGALVDQAVAGTSYGARVACSCRYVGGRDLADCEKDFEPGMEVVSLSENEADKSVTASVLFLVSQTATYREGPGCVLEPWSE